MERRLVEYPGAFYHVVQRGNNWDRIFRSDADERFLPEPFNRVKGKEWF